MVSGRWPPLVPSAYGNMALPEKSHNSSERGAIAQARRVRVLAGLGLGLALLLADVHHARFRHMEAGDGQKGPITEALARDESDES